MSGSKLDELLLALRQDGERAGYYLNPDEAFVRELLEGLIVNEGRYGYRACPCRLAMGVKDQDLDIICPCDYRDPDLNEYGACYCALYVTPEVVRGERQVRPIPERRGVPVQSRPAEPAEMPTKLAYPVWRCKVCGYLCARDKAPSVCPICKASAERFERFL